ncbi:E3 ubiquitin-protein ligase TRIM65 [Ctenodactylus gundi]
MAARLLEEKLTCAICLGLYQDPVTLACGHTFCRACIGDWRRQEPACPECRELVPEPRGNVALRGVVELLRVARPEPGPAPAARARCPLRECGRHEWALLDTERRELEAQLRARLEVIQQQATQATTQLEELQQQSSQIQSSACALASVVSGKFSRLLQALEWRRTLALRDMEAAKKQVLAQAQDEGQRLRGHLEALNHYSHEVRSVLEQVDDQSFLQESQKLSEPPEPLRPLTPLQWDEDQQLGDLKEFLSLLCGLLLEEQGPPKTPAETAALGPGDAPGPLAQVPDVVCPRRRSLWQNYRNLTFDPESANRHLHLSCQHQQVTHRRQSRDAAGPGSFELWQVQCAQSFQEGHHYWEVWMSDHSVTLGVAYPELPRRKLGTHTDNIGRESCSWGLCIKDNGAHAWHGGKVQRLPKVSGQLLGMDLDLAGGSLTFYSLEPETRPLHTFHALFSQPLRPVFWLLEGRTLTLTHQPGATLPPGPQEEASVLS